eukprot:3214502-Amphidinium_carterae.1
MPQPSGQLANEDGIPTVAVAVGREGRRETSSPALKKVFEPTHRYGEALHPGPYSAAFTFGTQRVFAHQAVYWQGPVLDKTHKRTVLQVRAFISSTAPEWQLVGGRRDASLAVRHCGPGSETHLDDKAWLSTGQFIDSGLKGSMQGRYTLEHILLSAQNFAFGPKGGTLAGHSLAGAHPFVHQTSRELPLRPHKLSL